MTLHRAEWRLELAPTLEAVEQFCVDFQIWRAGVCAELNPFATELLLREALTNSVVHGGSKAPARNICCVLRVKRGRLIIAIDDRGEGFDWRAAWDRQPDLLDDHGRGISIFRLYANGVRFNPKGSSVMLIRRF